MDVKEIGSYEERVYYTYNKSDLKAIVAGEYNNYDKMVKRIQNDGDISKRQKTTILEGISILKESIEKINYYIHNKKV